MKGPTGSSSGDSRPPANSASEADHEHLSPRNQRMHYSSRPPPHGHRQRHSSNSITLEQAVLDGEDAAERGLLLSVEGRRARARTASGGGGSGSGGGNDPTSWHAAAVEGERPPLASVPSNLPGINVEEISYDGSAATNGANNANSRASGDSSVQSGSRRPNFAEIARKARKMHHRSHHHNRAASGVVVGSDGQHQDGSVISSLGFSLPPGGDAAHHRSVSSAPSQRPSNHRRSVSKAKILLEAIQEDATARISGDGGVMGIIGGSDNKTKHSNSGGNNNNNIFEDVGVPAQSDIGESALAMEDTNTDRMITGAMQVERLFANDEQQDLYVLDAQAAPISSMELPSFHEAEPFGLEIDIDVPEDQLPLMARDQNGDDYGGTAVGAAVSSPNQVRYISVEAHEKLKNRRYRNKSVMQRLKHWVAFYCLRPQAVLLSLWQLVVECYSAKFGLALAALAWVFFYYLGNPEPDFLPGQASIAWWLNFAARQCVTLDFARLIQWIVIDGLILTSRRAVSLIGPLSSLVAINSKGWPFICMAWATIDLFALHGTHEFQQHWLHFTGIKFYMYSNSGLYVLGSAVYLRFLFAVIVAGMATAAKRTVVALYFGRRTFADFKPRLEKLLREIIVLSEIAELAEEAAYLEETSDVNFKKGKAEREVSWLKRQGYTDVGNVDDADDDDDEEEEEEGEDEDADNARVAGDEMEPERLDRNAAGNLKKSTSNGNLVALYLLDYWEEPINKLDKVRPHYISSLVFITNLSFLLI